MVAASQGQMSDPPRCALRISAAEHDTTITLELVGEWDLATQSVARDAVSLALERRPERIVLDLTGLSFIGSTGMHNLLEFQARCAEQDTQLGIIPGREAVQRPFEICQLTDRLPFQAAA